MIDVSADGRAPVVGVLGGGQLGRMLALAGFRLGLRFRAVDPAADSPFADVGPLIVGAWDDPRTLDEFARGVDVVTWETENVPVAAVEFLGARLPVRPGAASLLNAQDRAAEKRFLAGLGIRTARWSTVEETRDLALAGGEIGFPAILKTRRLGYDGRGQARVEDAQALDRAWATMDRVPCVLEEFVRFRRELSIVAVRGLDGECRFYPVVENDHIGGILHRTRAPAPDLAPALAGRAIEMAASVLAAVDHVGTLAIELFESDGDLLANEIAPRVHNSGHWTIDGAVTSQFENHLRAILGWPLGETAARGHSVMINILGAPPSDLRPLARTSTAIHLYGKRPRERRKVGHVTIVDPHPTRAADRADDVERLLGG